MKTIDNFSKRSIHPEFKVSIILFMGLLFLLSPSCQKDESNLYDTESHIKKDVILTTELSINSSALYYGHKTFSRTNGEPFIETQKIENSNFNRFDDNFILKIQNGRDKKTRVSSAEIRIDGSLIAGHSDFSKNVSFIIKQLNGLTSESILEVKLNGAPGGFIDLWIEGTLKDGIVADIDGNFYKTIKIGDQWWMAENLKTTKYRNGDLIETTNPATLDISSENTPEYQWAYHGNEINVTTNGRLFTWYTVTDSRNVCPAGWHVPTDSDWTTLTNYLTNNGYGFEGSGNDISKSMAATSGWATDLLAGNAGNDQTSNNRSGFTALPSGYRIATGTFTSLGSFTGWWSSTEVNATNAWYRGLYSGTNYVTSSYTNKNDAGSIRCVRD